MAADQMVAADEGREEDIRTSITSSDEQGKQFSVQKDGWRWERINRRDERRFMEWRRRGRGRGAWECVFCNVPPPPPPPPARPSPRHLSAVPPAPANPSPSPFSS
ncbi:hypothetical protein niasHT_015307 [Heterodera trifolii]|uniref:Uncharacterized protein n=1 Tax=Heterodera trifolii TaxID=157864 RepID=A0ABD2L0N2_9BILA